MKTMDNTNPIKEIEFVTKKMMDYKKIITELPITSNSLDELLAYNLPDLISLKHDIRKVLTPFEIEIRQYELKIKAITIALKNHPNYDEYKTIKAKEEQVTLDTTQIKEILLELKKNRNQLRDTLELIITVIHLEFILLELDEGINEDEGE